VAENSFLRARCRCRTSWNGASRSAAQKSGLTSPVVVSAALAARADVGRHLAQRLVHREGLAAQDLALLLHLLALLEVQPHAPDGVSGRPRR
jgi:hypothetical protein